MSFNYARQFCILDIITVSQAVMCIAVRAPTGLPKDWRDIRFNEVAHLPVATRSRRIKWLLWRRVRGEVGTRLWSPGGWVDLERYDGSRTAPGGDALVRGDFGMIRGSFANWIIVIAIAIGACASKPPLRYIPYSNSSDGGVLVTRPKHSLLAEAWLVRYIYPEYADNIKTRLQAFAFIDLQSAEKAKALGYTHFRYVAESVAGSWYETTSARWVDIAIHANADGTAYGSGTISGGGPELRNADFLIGPVSEMKYVVFGNISSCEEDDLCWGDKSTKQHYSSCKAGDTDCREKMEALIKTVTRSEPWRNAGATIQEHMHVPR